MTQNQFAILCAEFNIDPAIALENEDLLEALMDRDDTAVREILENEF